MKIVINTCWGGFGLSHEAMKEYARRKELQMTYEKDSFGDYDYGIVNEKGEGFYDYAGMNCDYFSAGDIYRNDPVLVEVVETMGKASFGGYAKLEVVEIPDGIKWTINDYDGMESIEEVHKSWS